MKRTIETNDKPGIDARHIAQQFCLFMGKIAKERAITHESIAEQTGLKRPNVTRFLTGAQHPTLGTVIKIAAVIGVQIEFKTVERANEESEFLMKRKTRG